MATKRDIDKITKVKKELANTGINKIPEEYCSAMENTNVEQV